MKIARERRGELVIMELEGEFDMISAPEFRSAWEEEMEGGARYFLIDFGKVSYIDSSGVAALIVLLKRARERGGDVALCCFQPEVYEVVVTLVRLDKIFRIFPTREEASSFLPPGS